jgi:hypothetical protein
MVIVLVVGGIIGYQIWHQKHGHNSGLVKEQTVTLTSGSDYGFTSSGDLKPTSGTAGYFLRVTGSGLSFPAGVHADTAPTWRTEYDDPCQDLGLPTYGDAASFPWKEFKAGTRLCAEPQGGVDVYDYLMTVKGLTSGQQLQVDITTWDEAKTGLNKLRTARAGGPPREPEQPRVTGGRAGDGGSTPTERGMK